MYFRYCWKSLASVSSVAAWLAAKPPLGFATVDLDRQRRQGLPEVIYAPGKQPGEIAAIAAALLDRREEITGLVRAAGFVFTTADLAGLRSGSMNALLPLPVVSRAGQAR